MTLSEDITDRILLFESAADSQGTLISIDELLPLLPDAASPSDVAMTLASSPKLNARFELREGFVRKRGEHGVEQDTFVRESVNRLRAKSNLAHGANFVKLLQASRFEMVAASGSSSYGSASKSTDLDFFCVVQTGKLWLSVAQGLLLARAFRLLHPRGPQICLSCIMDGHFAAATFRSDQGPLFARDALETKVMKGAATFASLLRTAAWISDVYPVWYTRRTAEDPAALLPTSVPSSFAKFLNRFLFLTVGTFLRAKSKLLNRSFLRSGRRDHTFEFRSGEDHLIYESARYAKLRLEYSSVLAKRTDVQI